MLCFLTVFHTLPFILPMFYFNFCIWHSITSLLVNLECSSVSRDTLMLYSAIKRKLTWLDLTVRDLGVTLDSALTFSQHISNLTRASYFQLRRLRTIRKAVSVPIFTSSVHAFVCSRIDYCNSLLFGLPKTRLSLLQTVLNAAARLIARLPRYSHISYYIEEHLHWLPISTRIE